MAKSQYDSFMSVIIRETSYSSYLDEGEIGVSNTGQVSDSIIPISRVKVSKIQSTKHNKNNCGASGCSWFLHGVVEWVIICLQYIARL